MTDTSEVALVALVRMLSDGRPRLLDVPWRTSHLASMGVVEVDRTTYLGRPTAALATPVPHWSRSSVSRPSPP